MFRIRASLDDLGEFHSAALFSIQSISNRLNEAVQESFAYVVSADPVERDEFRAWSAGFESEADAFRQLAHLDQSEEAQEQALFDSILAAQARLVEQADSMFTEFQETGSVTVAQFERYEAAIEACVGSLTRLVALERQEVSEAQEQAVAIIRSARSLVLGGGIIVVVTAVLVGAVLARYTDRYFRHWMWAESETRLAQTNLAGQRAREKETVETQLAEARAKLLQQARLAAIGQVAASIAHELRNPLGAARNAAYFLRRKVASDNRELSEHLTTIDAELDSANSIIESLLELTRATAPDREPIELHEFLTMIVEHEQLDGAIRCHFSVQPNPFWIYADPGMLRQVLHNLLTNASQQLESGGEIIIEATRTDRLDSIIVRDDGPGVSAQNRAKIFEPLFTTKAKGTGLGLAICQKLAAIHDGVLELVDEGASGAAFRLSLPRLSHEPASPAPSAGGEIAR